MLSLANCRSCLLMDDELNILPTSSHAKSLKPVETDGVEVYRPCLYPQYLSLNCLRCPALLTTLVPPHRKVVELEQRVCSVRTPNRSH